MISAWRFSIKSTLISTIRTDNNHTLTVRVTAFPPYALYVCTACSLPKAKRASMAERTLTLLLAWMKKWSDAYCVYPLPPPTRPRRALAPPANYAGTVLALAAFCASRSSRHSTNCQRSFCASCTVLCISFKILCKKNLRFSERTFGKSF